jgi:hypothetical protein
MVDDWDILDGQIKGLEAKVADPMMPAKVTSLAAVVATVRTDFTADRTAGRVAAIPRYKTVVQRLWSDVEPDKSPKKMWESLVLQFGGGGLIGLFVLLAVFISVGILMAFYMSSAGFVELRTIEGARPLLTIAAIVATLPLAEVWYLRRSSPMTLPSKPGSEWRARSSWSSPVCLRRWSGSTLALRRRRIKRPPPCPYPP